jgi:hypothetical protein
MWKLSSYQHGQVFCTALHIQTFFTEPYKESISHQAPQKKCQRFPLWTLQLTDTLIIQPIWAIKIILQLGMAWIHLTTLYPLHVLQLS